MAKFKTIVLCDDIRREATGKDILIGVYGASIEVPFYPFNFPAALWIEIEPETTGSIPIVVRIETPSGNPPIETKGTLVVAALEPAVLVIVGLPLTLEHDGEVIVRAGVDESALSIVQSKKVRRRSVAGEDLTS